MTAEMQPKYEIMLSSSLFHETDNEIVHQKYVLCEL